MELQWKDLSVCGILVKGNFLDGFFIKETRVEFERVSICEGRIFAYLPLERERKECCGRKDSKNHRNHRWSRISMIEKALR